MSQQYDNTNRGIVSKNDRKEKDTHPDIKGHINVEGVEYWLDGWKKEGSRGPFYSLSVKRKDGQGAGERAYRSEDAQDKRQAQNVSQGRGFDDSDEIPF